MFKQGQAPYLATDAAGRPVWHFPLHGRSILAIAGGDGTAPPNDGQAPPPADPPAAPPAAPPAPPAEPPKVFDAEYVEKLRRENADHRTRATKAEAELAKHKQAQETEAEKIQRERDEAATRADTAEKALRSERTKNAIITAAAKVNVDPTLAVRLMAAESVEYDADGNPKDVDKALGDLIKQYPQLAATQSGGSSAANGARSANGQPAETDAERRQRILGGGAGIFASPASAR